MKNNHIEMYVPLNKKLTDAIFTPMIKDVGFVPRPSTFSVRRSTFEQCITLAITNATDMRVNAQ